MSEFLCLATSSMLVCHFSFTVTTLVGFQMQSLILTAAQLVESTSFFSPWELCQGSRNLPWLVQKPFFFFFWSCLKRKCEASIGPYGWIGFHSEVLWMCKKSLSRVHVLSFQRRKRCLHFLSVFSLDAALLFHLCLGKSVTDSSLIPISMRNKIISKFCKGMKTTAAQTSLMHWIETRMWIRVVLVTCGNQQEKQRKWRPRWK